MYFTTIKKNRGKKGKIRENVIVAKEERQIIGRKRLEIGLHICRLFVNKSDEEIQWERKIFSMSVGEILRFPYG